MHNAIIPVVNPVAHGIPLARDTSPEFEQRQIAAWRAMAPAQKAATVSGLTQAAYSLALAGVRHRYPDASPREQFLRLARPRWSRILRPAHIRHPRPAGAVIDPVDPIGVALLVTRTFESLGIMCTIDRAYLEANAPALEVDDLLRRALAS